MLLRIISDLHLEYLRQFETEEEFQDEFIAAILPVLPEDNQTVLILAGDISNLNEIGGVDRLRWLLDEATDRFKHVIYVLGNHEHYYQVVSETYDLLRRALEATLSPEKMAKITMAGNHVKVFDLDGYTFVIGTLWTDVGGFGEFGRNCTTFVEHGMTDFKRLKVLEGDELRNLRARDVRVLFVDALNVLRMAMDGASNKKTIVVTHFLPSMRAVHPKYLMTEKDVYETRYFVSDLDHLIEEWQPALWVFGHTHVPQDFYIGPTRLYCNPLGYTHENNYILYRFKTDEVIKL